MSDNLPENIENQNEEQESLFLERINKIISNEKLENILKLIFDRIKELQAYKKGIIEANAYYFLIQYSMDIVMVVVILLAVMWLSCYQMIESATTGTLVGSVIGYALGRFRNRGNN